MIKTSRMSNLTCFLRELSPAKRRGSDLIRNLLLSFFFGEKSQAMKRPSLRSVKCLPRRDRDALLVVVLYEPREKGTEGLRLLSGSSHHHRELSACSHLSELKHFCSNRDAIHPGPVRRVSCHHLDVEEQTHHTVVGSVV